MPEEIPGKHEVDRPRIKRAVREILFTIGEGSERTGLLGTPERVADACAFSFCWWAYVQQQDTQREEIVDRAPERQPVLERPEAVGKRRAVRAAERPLDALVVAGGPPRGAEVAGPVGNALVLLASVVERAPSSRTASVA